jgi:hypothetical protein
VLGQGVNSNTYQNYFFTTFNGGGGVNFWALSPETGPLFMRVRISGGNVLWEFTTNPNTASSWRLIRSVASATVFPSGANRSGFFAVVSSNADAAMRVWVQHAALS